MRLENNFIFASQATSAFTSQALANLNSDYLTIEVHGSATDCNLTVQGLCDLNSEYVDLFGTIVGGEADKMSSIKTIEANGIYNFNVGGIIRIRVKINSVSGGEITVFGKLTESNFSLGAGSGGGGGGGDSGIYIQPEAPEDTDGLWVDTDDTTDADRLLPDVEGSGKALVSVDGEWKEQDGYGYKTYHPAISISWDGSTEGRELFDDHYKVSDIDIPNDRLVGSVITNSDGSVVRVTQQYYDFYVNYGMINDAYAVLSGYIYIFHTDVIIESGSISKGVYFRLHDSEFTESILVPEKVSYSTINQNYFEDGTVGKSSFVESGFPVWDGDTTGRDRYDVEDSLLGIFPFYKVAELDIIPEDVGNLNYYVGFTVNLADMNPTLIRMSSIDNGAIFYSTYSNTEIPVLVILTSDIEDGSNVSRSGVYYLGAEDDFVLISVKNKEITSKIDSKYLESEIPHNVDFVVDFENGTVESSETQTEVAYLLQTKKRVQASIFFTSREVGTILCCTVPFMSISAGHAYTNQFIFNNPFASQSLWGGYHIMCSMYDSDWHLQKVFSLNQVLLPSVEGSGKALVSVNGEWAKQDGYGYTIPGNQTIIEWDGNTEGRYVYNSKYYRVADAVYTSNFESATATFYVNGEISEPIIGGLHKIEDGVYKMVYPSGVVYDGTIVITNDIVIGGIFVRAGTYFIKDDEDGIYQTSLTYITSDEVHKIDSKYLPASPGTTVINYVECEDGEVVSSTYTPDQLYELLKTGNVVIMTKIEYNADDVYINTETTNICDQIGVDPELGEIELLTIAAPVYSFETRQYVTLELRTYSTDYEHYGDWEVSIVGQIPRANGEVF